MEENNYETTRLWILIMIFVSLGMIAFTAYETLVLKNFSVIESDYYEEE